MKKDFYRVMQITLKTFELTSKNNDKMYREFFVILDPSEQKIDAKNTHAQ